jgi:hypothetical protein
MARSFVPAIARSVIVLTILTVAAVGAAGCEPAAPGAAGTVSLGPDVDSSSFQTLALRAFARPSAAFDPSLPIPWGPWKNEALAALTFPHQYKIGGGIGDVDDTEMLFVAWLSHRGDDSLKVDNSGLDPGDVYCSVPFHIDAGRFDGDNVTYDVDCTLTEVVPASR